MLPEQRFSYVQPEVIEPPLPEGVSIINAISRGDYTTVSGRPVYELSTDSASIQNAVDNGIKFDLQKSKQQGSRKGYDVNISALTDLSSRWQDVLNGLVWLRNNCYGDDQEDIPIQDAIALCVIANAMPSFLVNRATNTFSPYGEIPDSVGGVFKTTAGLDVALKTLSETIKSQASFNVEKIYTIAENKRLFIENGRACPAPKTMILSAVKALLKGEGGNPDESELGDLFPNTLQLAQFANIHARYTEELSTLHDIDRETFTQLNTKSNARLLLNPISKHQTRKVYSHYQRKWHEVIDQFGPMQDTMNTALGRNTAYPHPTTKDINTSYPWKVPQLLHSSPLFARLLS